MRSSGQSPSAGRAGPQSLATLDAIGLLEAGHRQLDAWFEDFANAETTAIKAALARSICHALKVHTTIEEEIFHPAFLDATAEQALHHEAEVEHAGVRYLMSQIEAAGPADEGFDAKVTALGEALRHHIKEEEQGGMFVEARRSGMDLRSLGRQMAARKLELDCAVQ